MKRCVAIAVAALWGSWAGAQYQDYSQMGKTPAELRFIDDPMEIELKEPSWWFHNPKKKTPEDQLAYAQSLEREGKKKKAAGAYDDLVHEWHATPEALTAQLALARIWSDMGEAQQAYDADVYLLAHFSGRFTLEPVLKDAVAQADWLAERQRAMSLKSASWKSLRENYERIIHFAPRWPRVPELLLKIAALYNDEKEYASAITVCDRIFADWPKCSVEERCVRVYCQACRDQATVWARDAGRLHQLERLLAGACAFRPSHPDVRQFAAWQAEIHLMRQKLAYEQTRFYDNPKAYSVEAAIRGCQTFLRDFPEAPEAEAVRARLAELSLQLHGVSEE